MFATLEQINSRPRPFEFYTAEELWTNEHTAKQMLQYHLDDSTDAASRRFEFIDNSVEWISAYFSVDETTRIADFGCGPGLYASRLAGRGALVTAIDFSKNSLRYAMDYAEAQSLKIDYIHENYLNFQSDKRFDLIMMIFCDFCVLSPGQRSLLLKKFASYLAPGGSVLLDCCSLHGFSRKKECAVYEKNLLDGFWSADEYYGFLNTFRYEDEKVSLDKYTIFEKDTSPLSKPSTVYNWLQYYSLDTLAGEFEESGFFIAESFGDVTGGAYRDDGDEFAVVARRLLP